MEKKEILAIDDDIDMLNKGCAGWLEKPFSKLQMEESVKALLEKGKSCARKAGIS